MTQNMQFNHMLNTTPTVNPLKSKTAFIQSNVSCLSLHGSTDLFCTIHVSISRANFPLNPLPFLLFTLYHLSIVFYSILSEIFFTDFPLAVSLPDPTPFRKEVSTSNCYKIIAIFIVFLGFYLYILQEPLHEPCNQKKIVAVIF